MVCAEEQENGLPAPQIGRGGIQRGAPPTPAAPPGPRTTPGLPGGAAGSACPHPGSLFNVTRGCRCSRALGGAGVGRGGTEIKLWLLKGTAWCGACLCRGSPRPAPLEVPAPSPPFRSGGAESRPRWQQGSGTQSLLGRPAPCRSPPRGLRWRQGLHGAPQPAPAPRHHLWGPAPARSPRRLPALGPSPPSPAAGWGSPPATASVCGPRSAAAPARTPAGPSLGERLSAPAASGGSPSPRGWARRGLSGSFGTGGGTSAR